MVTAADDLPVTRVEWKGAVRIIRSAFPPIDLFEDIADPADWPLLISAEQKTNPRIMATIGNLDLVPADRRIAGSGASYLMAPFTHASIDRSSRFADGSFGVLYAAKEFETALFETIHHHARFVRTSPFVRLRLSSLFALINEVPIIGSRVMMPLPRRATSSD